MLNKFYYLYLFITNPTPGLTKPFVILWFAISVGCVLLALALTHWLKHRPAGTPKRIYQKIRTWAWSTGVVTAIWTFLRYERVPILSMRLWYYLYLLALLLSLAWLLRGRWLKKRVR